MLFQPRPKGLGKDNFVKLGDGQEIMGVFRGTPHTFRQHWINNQSTECIGAECPLCKAEQSKAEPRKPSFRFRINLITTVDGKYVPKIFEGGGELYDDLVDLDKKFNLAATPVSIMRRGLKKDTRYSIIPRADKPVTKEMEELISQVKLLPLCAQGEE
jgi:hypothetical protein